MIKTKNTIKALSSLKQKTTNEIIILSESKFEEKFQIKLSGNGAHYSFNHKHYICVNEKIPDFAQECSFVHECLHAILRIEQYPCCYLEGRRDFGVEEKKSLLAITGKLTDALHHPEIYKRMIEEYNLDIGRYFESLLKVKIERLEKIKVSSSDNISLVYISQQNFIDAFEYFFYPEKIKLKLFQKMKEIYPDNYSFLIGIKEKKRKFDTPENAKLSINGLLNKIKKYGKKRNAEVLNNQVWDLMLIK
jgi:hypothetical protein